MRKLLLVLFLFSISSNVFADKWVNPDYDYEWYYIHTMVYEEPHSFAHEHPNIYMIPKKNEKACLTSLLKKKKEENLETHYDHLDRLYLIDKVKTHKGPANYTRYTWCQQMRVMR